VCQDFTDYNDDNTCIKKYYYAYDISDLHELNLYIKDIKKAPCDVLGAFKIIKE